MRKAQVQNRRRATSSSRLVLAHKAQVQNRRRATSLPRLVLAHEAQVFFDKWPAGILTEEDNGRYVFEYAKDTCPHLRAWHHLFIC